MNVLIVTGGFVNIDFLNNIYNNFDFIIACDHGLEAIRKCNIKPDYIIGDFDSVDNTILSYYNDVEIVKLNPEKDFTDTHMALKKAIEMNCSNVTIIGGTGSRIDHLLGNIHILKDALDYNIDCKLIDDNNEIFLINKKTTLISDNSYKYVSLIPLTTEVTGITLTGFKYKLENDSLSIGHSIGVSNELLFDGTIEIKDGILIVIKSRD